MRRLSYPACCPHEIQSQGRIAITVINPTIVWSEPTAQPETFSVFTSAGRLDQLRCHLIGWCKTKLSLISRHFTPNNVRPYNIAGQKIVKALTVRKQTDNALTLSLWGNSLTFNGQRIVWLCKSLTVNPINF